MKPMNRFSALLAAVWLASCEKADDSPQSRSLPNASAAIPTEVDRCSKNPASCSMELELQDYSETFSGLVTPIDLRDNKIVGLTEQGGLMLFDLTLGKVEREFKLPVDFDGLSAGSIFARSLAIDVTQTISEWVIFDDSQSGSIKNASVALKEPSGEVVFLESGRKWFISEAKSQLRILASFPDRLILLDGQSLTVIKRAGPTFELTKHEIGFIDKVYSATSSSVVVLGQDKKIKIVSIKNAAKGFDMSAVEFDIENSETINAITFLETRQELLVFSSFNKLLDMTQVRLTPFMSYIPFSKGEFSRTIAISDKASVGISASGKIQKVAFKGD